MTRELRTVAALALALAALPRAAHAGGGLGDSCFSTRDCAPGLKCIDNACGREIPADATARTRPPPTRPNGPAKQGESCYATRDCAQGMSCIDNVCGYEVPPSAMKPGSGPLGAKGESCRARSDCSAGLACIKSTCVDPNAPPKDEEEGGESWLSFDLHGSHAFVGLGAMAGPVIGFTTGALSASPQRVDTSALFALRAGAIFDNQELAIELSPMTYWPTTSASGPSFQVNGTYGYYAPIHDSAAFSVYWPVRLGVGFFAGPGNNANGLAYFQAVLDVIGPAFRIGHIIIDVRAPSFRYAITGSQGVQAHILAWEIGGTANYVF